MSWHPEQRVSRAPPPCRSLGVRAAGFALRRSLNYYYTRSP